MLCPLFSSQLRLNVKKFLAKGSAEGSQPQKTRKLCG